MLVARNRRPKMLGAPSFPLSRVGLQRVHKGAASVGLTGPNGVRHILSSRTPMPVRLGAVAWYNFTDSSKLIGGATPTTDVAGWKDSAATLENIQLLTNSDFDTDVSSWDTSGVTAVWNNGIAEITSAVTGTYPYFKQGHSTTESGWYTLEFNATLIDSVVNILILPYGGGTRPYEGIISVGESSIDFYYDNTQGNGTGFNVWFQLNQPTSGDRLYLNYVRLKKYIIPPYDLSQLDSAFQPTFTQPNGPVVFNGNDYLEGLPAQSGDFTYVFGGLTYPTNTTARILTESNTLAERFYHQTNVGGQWVARSDDGTYFVATLPIVNYSSLTLRKKDGLLSIYGDGVLVANLGDATGKDFTILRLGNASASIQGDLNELAVFDRGLTDSEITQLNSWMDR